MVFDWLIWYLIPTLEASEPDHYFIEGTGPGNVFTNEEEIFSPRENDILDIMVETGYLIKTFEHIISPSESSKEDQTVYDFVRLVLNTIENALLYF